MSNRDPHGFERPWFLSRDTFTAGSGHIRVRCKIVSNRLHENANEITEAQAFAACAKEAIVLGLADAINAMNDHLKDLHKWP